ncbi:copper resistance protein CopC [Phytohabitans sp. ZYX-F-186]|uniref:Copper resistance protein CopC n=1 Tax=Phytohabitans maris TaxID=3071409 RepID=A0ABU0ZGZ8_9ACTN|nr:copper resistance protein CopC [Phytohabitans sp. ZYX-F-186]MDQ7906326.1 copper resistance protein CopC [Phytohabitans sp. ZYX-F-186]
MRPLPSPGRALSASFALLLATAAAVLAAAPPAAAHGTLAMSTPAEGATVTAPVTSVELYFTEKVAANAYFTITAPGGGRVDGGWTYGSPKPLDKPVREYFMVDGKFEPREYTTGFPAVVTVAHLPAAGQYSVSYLSVASDGEAVRGTMTFRYAGKATAVPRGWTAPTNQPDPALVAAVERHGTSAGQGSTGSPSAPAAPPVSPVPPAAAPAGTVDDGGGSPAWVTWSGWAVAIAAAVAGFLGWRRRPAVASGPPGRARPSGPRSGQRGGKRPAGKTAGASARSAGSSGASARSGGSSVPAVDGAAAGSAVDGGAPAGGLTNTRLALLAGGLVVALLGGFGLGRLGTGGEAGTAGAPAAPTSTGGGAVTAGDGHQHPAGTGPHSHPGDANTAQATGTTVSAGGYTLRPDRRAQPAGATVDYRFQVVGADRRAATRFTVVHDKTLHLIVVGRDLSGYQHLHPTMAPDGTWSVPLTLARAGGYRVYADFTVTATDGTQLPLVLGVDHHVPGAHTPAALPPAAPRAVAGPFAVSMEGTPTIGVTAPMFFRVSRTGAPGPTQLERYLGAYGHLVVVREGDLGYVHVHPEPEMVDGAVKFWLTAPSTGRYRAFLDFQVAGEVHTAEYTMDVA